MSRWPQYLTLELCIGVAAHRRETVVHNNRDLHRAAWRFIGDLSTDPGALVSSGANALQLRLESISRTPDGPVTQYSAPTPLTTNRLRVWLRPA